MTVMPTWTTHPLTLLSGVIAGAILGLVSPTGSAIASVFEQVFIRLMEMTALPLLIVAVVFGLRNVMSLPHRGRRLASVLLTTLITLWGCGLLGAFVGQRANNGQSLSQEERLLFGKLIQHIGSEDSRDVLTLSESSEAVTNLEPAKLDNIFAALVQGNIAALLGCALLFGLPFTLLGREATQTIANQLEAVYRALEQLIMHSLHLMPLLVFGMAAYVTAHIDFKTLRLFDQLIGTLLLASLPVVALALHLISKTAGCSWFKVLDALQMPLLVSMVVPSPVAAIPSTIDALSQRLGISRGITELMVPMGTVFMRSGTVLYTALIVVFVAEIYGQPLGLSHLFKLGTLAAVATLMTTSAGVFGPLSAIALTLTWLEMPVEGVLPVLLLVDCLCIGLRQVVTVICLSATIALVSRDQALERPSISLAVLNPPIALRRITLNRTSAALVLTCILGAGVLCTLVGMGVGMRMEVTR
jgi:Na+/H+-dicarboxylate symporter